MIDVTPHYNGECERATRRTINILVGFSDISLSLYSLHKRTESKNMFKIKGIYILALDISQ
jgi:muramoyltetrapeptide carboxypeptidase LdcA involved in peptidoglycan recycling